MKKVITVVMRRNGDKLIPWFPVELEANVTVITATILSQLRIPEEQKRTIGK